MAFNKLQVMNFIPAGERILLTLWAGGLWSIGYIAAPTLFAVLDDRKQAGMLAGQMFHIINYIGLFCGALLLAGMLLRKTRNWQLWVIVVMLVLVGCSEFIIQPFMQELKAGGIDAGSEQAKLFGRMHGVASILYLVTSLSALALVATGLCSKRDS